MNRLCSHRQSSLCSRSVRLLSNVHTLAVINAPILPSRRVKYLKDEEGQAWKWMNGPIMEQWSHVGNLRHHPFFDKTITGDADQLVDQIPQKKEKN